MKEDIRMDMGQECGRIFILITTYAAGMGVNYKGVHHIIQNGIPQDMDSFTQQLRRAKGDGFSQTIFLYAICVIM